MPTNLMPEGFEQAPAQKDYTKVATILLAVVLLVWLGALGTNFWLEKQMGSMEEKITNLNEQVEASLGSQTATLVRKLEKVSDLLNQRTYWSETLTRIEENTLTKTVFNNFSGRRKEEKGGKAVVSLQGDFDNYTSLAQQIIVFKDVFKSVDFSLTGGEGAGQEGDSEEGEGGQQEDASKIQASLELTF